MATNDDIREFYGSGSWAKKRAAALLLWGEVCRDCGTAEGPFEVDHIESVKDAWDMRLLLTNTQVLCIPCHDRKHRR